MQCSHILRLSSTSTPKQSANSDDLYHCASEICLLTTSDPIILNDKYTLCLLGIPLELSITELNAFIEPYASEIYATNVIYNKSLHGYKCAVLTFVDKLGLAAFCNLYNNLHYPTSSGLVAPCVAIAAMISDATTTDSCAIDTAAYPLPQCVFCLSKLHTNVSHVQLPLLQEYCHTDNRCLVCDIYNNTNHESRVCWTCGLRENIWMCLLCGHTGCGRYTSQHAQLHYQASDHAYSLELATGRIWDYTRDTFVHADLPAPIESSLDPPTHSKLTSLHSDYEALLELQLEDQRLYYEKMLARETVRLLEHTQPAASALESKDDSIPAAATGTSETEDTIQRAETIKMDISMQEYAYAQLLDEIRIAEQQTAELRKRNNALLKTQKDMRCKCSDLAKRKAELSANRVQQSQQLRQEIQDLEFYVRMQREVEASPLKEEVRSGVMIVAEDSSSSNRKDKHRKRVQRR